MKRTLFLVLFFCLLVKGSLFSQDNALHYDGVNDFVSIPELGTNLTSFAFEAWIKPEPGNNDMGLLMTNSWSGGSVHLQFGGGVLFLAIGGLNQAEFGGGWPSMKAALKYGEWQHVAVSYDGMAKRIVFYYNGMESGNYHVSSMPAVHLTVASIGSWAGGSRFYKGAIDEVRIWNDFLLPSEVKTNACVDLVGDARLMAYYKFNQGVAAGNNTTFTTLFDDALAGGMARVGTLHNFSLQSGSVSNWISSRNNALHFDGAGDFITVPQKGTGINNFTIESWIKPERNTGLQGIFTTDAWSNGSIKFHLVDSLLEFSVNGIDIEETGGVMPRMTSPIIMDSWQHVAVSYDGTAKKIVFYHNGIESGSYDVPSMPVINLTSATIGKDGYTSQLPSGGTVSNYYFFGGKIDELRIWNVARSAAEIGSTSDAHLTGFESGLLAYYNFNQGMVDLDNDYVTTLTDKSTSNPLNGTLFNFRLESISNWKEHASGDNCLNFDGVDDYVDMAPSAYVDYSAGFTATAYVRVKKYFNDMLRISDARYSTIIFTSGGFLLKNKDKPFEQVSTSNYPFNQWYHVAITISPTEGAKLYINGVVQVTLPGFSLVASGDYKDQKIGKSFFGYDKYFEGSMDELSWWNKPLTQEEIVAAMNNGFTGSESGLLHYYKFNQGVAYGSNTSVTTLTDAAASGAQNGTLTNFTLESDGKNSNWTSGFALPAKLSTIDASSISKTGATINASVTALGVSSPTQHGVVWSKSPNPTVGLGTKSEQGSANVGAFSYAITGLDVGTKYYVRAYATNSAGTSYGNQLEFTTLADVPTPPTDVTAVAGDTRAVVNFTIPHDNGSEITNYRVTSFPELLEANGTSSPITINGLTNGTTYYFMVTATNAIGMSAPSAQSNEVTPFADTEKPVISGMPANISVNTEAGLDYAMVTWTEPTASDNVHLVSFESDYISGAHFGVGTTTVTYTATDASSNTETASFTITVTDAEMPVISGMPASVAIPTEQDKNYAVLTWTEPVASDNVGVVTFESNYPSGYKFPVGATTVTYTADDAAGNHTAKDFVVTFFDDQKPVIHNIPASRTVLVSGEQNSAIVEWNSPTVTDNVGIASFISSHASGSQFPLGVTTVAYTATDAANNIATASFTIDVISDGEKPVISNVPADIVVDAWELLNYAVVTWDEPSATDNIGIDAFTPDYQSGSQFPVGITTVTYTAYDMVGNTETASFTITVNDVEKPRIENMPSTIDVNQDAGKSYATVSWPEPTAVDNVGVVSFTSNYTSGSQFNVGETVVTYTATDAANNSYSQSFTITVRDTEKPVITGIPSDFTVSTDDGKNYATVTWPEPTATDNVGIDVFSSNLANGTQFNLGTTQVTYTAVDESNNEITAIFYVTVIDTEAPTFGRVPESMIAYVKGDVTSERVDWTAPWVFDNVGVTSQSASHSPGDAFPLGVTTVTYTASDAAGNTSNIFFTIEVISDGVKPTITDMPQDMEVSTDAGKNYATVTWTEPTATDDLLMYRLTSDYSIGSQFPLGTTTVTYTASDFVGNIETATFSITVIDTESPVISSMPENIVTDPAPGANYATVSWVEPTATDNVGVVSLVSDHDIGSQFGIGTTVVTYTATDAAGNTKNESFNVTLREFEKPVIKGMPSDITVSTDAGMDYATVTWAEPTANDNDGISTFGADFASGTQFPLGETTVTYTAVDHSGNIATATFTITVSDTESPVISGMPESIAVNTDEGMTYATVTWVEPIATDNVGVANFVADYTNGSQFPIGTTTVTYTATDAANNTQTARFTITVTSTTDVPDGKTFDVSVYPNPAKDELRIRTGNDLHNGTYTIISTLGLVVKKGAILNGSADINIESLMKGIYVVKLQVDSNIRSITIVKE